MPSNLNLDYYYGTEADQYSFYRIPKTLLTDPRYKDVSIEAKVLYGLLLDRMSLSVKNNWMDIEKRIYIYFTLENVMSMLDCGHNKAVRLFAELDSTGLIERVKQGQGKPARVYVKNFTLPPPPENSAPAPVPAPSALTSEKPQSVLRDVPAAQTSEIQQSALRGSSGQDCGKTVSNKTDKNDTELSDTEHPIHPPAPLPPKRRPAKQSQRERIDQMDAYRALICENIDYEGLLREHPYDQDLFDGYVELMVEVCCTRRETVRVNQEDIPVAVVRSRFLKLDREHILYVMEAMQRNTTQVANIRAYTLSALYNAPATIGQYYASQVSHDMAQGWGVET